MNRSVIRALITTLIAMSALNPVAVNADLNGTPSGIPGIDYPIIPGVNAPAASAPAGAPTVNPDGSLVNPPFVLPPGFRPGDAAPLPPP